MQAAYVGVGASTACLVMAHHFGVSGYSNGLQCNYTKKQHEMFIILIMEPLLDDRDHSQHGQALEIERLPAHGTQLFLLRFFVAFKTN